MTRSTARVRLTAGVAVLIAGLFLSPSPTGAQQSTGCDVSWTGGDGNWSDPTRWSSGQPPEMDQRVCIDSPGTYTVTLDSDVVVVSLVVGATNQRAITLRVGGSPLALLDVDRPLQNYGTIEDDPQLSNQAGQIEAFGGIENHGVIRVHEHLALVALTNHADGTIDLDGGLLFVLDESRPLLNFGTIAGGQDSSGNPNTLEAFGGIENHGLIRVRNHLAMTALTNHPSGTISLDEAQLIVFDAARPLLNLGTIESGTGSPTGPSFVDAAGGIENSGTIRVRGELALTGLTNGEGGVLSLDSAQLFVVGDSKLLLNLGTIESNSGADGNPTLVNVDGSVHNFGLIQVDHPLFIEATDGIENSGVISVHEELALTALTNSSQGIISLSGARLFVLNESAPLLNAGLIESRSGEDESPNQIEAAGGVRNAGVVDIENMLATAAFTNESSGLLRFHVNSTDGSGPPLLVENSLVLKGIVDLILGDANSISPGSQLALIFIGGEPPSVAASVTTDRPELGGELSVVEDAVSATLTERDPAVPRPGRSGNAGWASADHGRLPPIVIASILGITLIVFRRVVEVSVSPPPARRRR